MNTNRVKSSSCVSEARLIAEKPVRDGVKTAAKSYSRDILTMILGLVLVGCGASPGKRYEVDPGLEPYIAHFQEVSKNTKNPVKKIDNLTAKFVDFLPPDTLGRCSLGIYMPMVTINRARWKEMDTVSREQVIFHELGHCILRREHDESGAKTTHGIPIPKSLMSSQKFSSTTFSWNYLSYIKELFEKNNDLTYDNSADEFPHSWYFTEP